MIFDNNDSFDEEDKRNGYYTQILKQFTENHKKTHCARIAFKWIFFCIVCLSFIAVVTAGVFAIITISKKDKIDSFDVGVAVTGLGSVLSAIIVLPKIIAKHLFPEDGDVKEFSFVKDMLGFDIQAPEYYNDKENIAVAEESENG